jgi:PAS domain S-box-containing protein
MKVKTTGRSGSDREKKTVRRAKAQSSATPAALQENEEGLQTFFNALDDLVFVFEPEGRILFANPAAQKQLGYTPAELAGMTALDLHPPEQRAEAAKLLAGMIADKIMICPIPLQARDGTRILVETKLMHGQWRGQKTLLGISHDITQRKQAEETLQHERNLFRTILDNLPSIIFFKDKDGRYVLSNRAHQGVLGVTQESLLGKTGFDFHPPELARQYQEEEMQIIRTGEPLPPKEELALNRGMGGHRWHLTSRIPFKDENGRVIGTFGISHDITERKRAEEVLRESQALYHSFVDQLPAAVFRRDREGRYVMVNPRFCQLKGVKAEEFLGKTPIEVAALQISRQGETGQATKYAALGDEIHKQIMRTGKPVEMEEEYTGTDGGKQFFQVVRMPVFGPDRTVVGTQGILFDVTARKQAEEAVRQSEERYRALVETAPDVVYVISSEGVFTSLNPAFEAITGWACTEWLGKPFAPLLHPEDAPLAVEMFQKVLRGDKPPPYELRILSKSGKYLVGEFTSTPYIKDGKVAGKLGIIRDITERKQTEVALRESQALYHSLVEQLPAGVFRKDKEGRYVFVNSWFCRLKGVKAELFLGKNPQEVATIELAAGGTNPSQINQLAVQGADHHQQIMQTGRQIEVEEHGVGDDGKEQHLYVVKSPIFDSDGKIVGTQGVMFDITERKNAEKALRQGEVRLEKINRCLLELGPNFDSNINRLTALGGELLGATYALYNRLQGDLLCSIGQWQTPPGFKSEDAPAGHICYDVIRNNREDAVVIANLPRTSYAESDPNVRAYGLQTYMGCAVKCEGKAVGSLCVVYGTDYRPTDDDRRILGIIASAIGNEDTRKQAEAELNRLMTAIEQTPESVVITDTKGRILYVNPVFERVTGYSRAEVIGQNPRLLKSNRQDSAFYRELWAKISAGEVWRGRFINKKKDGTLFTEDAVIAPVRDGKGAVTNYIAIKRDISHELELEVQYRQTQKIDSIGRLAGGVAHDFNNILAVICGHTELALAQLSPDAPLRSNLECIQESAERAANLTRQLLAFARRQVIEPRRINLNELIVNLNKMLHRLIGEDIKLVTQIAPDLGQIKADPGQIEQVLLNLVVNARDAMPDGGTLTIRTANVTLDEDYARRHLITPGDYVMVSISDTGVGMTDEVKQHIFEPFFTTKEQGNGTGLGLATCFGIIQQSNGHIHFESQVDEGAEFTIYLPRVQGAEEPASRREVPVSLPQGTETILLAEDEPSLRQLMARVLRTQGYTVLEAADGHQALSLAQTNGSKIQLLVTDVIMPGLSGKTLAEWLGQVNPATRVLFISGYINNNAVRDAMSKPGTFFLQKPFNPLDLTEKVREAIEAP